MNTKTIVFLLFVLLAGQKMMAQNLQELEMPADQTALVLIDIQMFYFEDGQMPLHNTEKASKKAGQLLEAFRSEGLEVIHVRHDIEKNAGIHPDVAPIAGEKVITKKKANSFAGTNLASYLEKKGMKHLVIAGMMTHMCVEATARAASDMGHHVLVASDACATRDIKYQGEAIPARHVHLSTLASLEGTYGQVLSTKELREMIESNE